MIADKTKISLSINMKLGISKKSKATIEKKEIIIANTTKTQFAELKRDFRRNKSLLEFIKLTTDSCIPADESNAITVKSE